MEKDKLLLEGIFQDLEHLISISYLNAFYSALILKKQSGVEITSETEREVLAEVFSKHRVIQNQLLEAVKKVSTQREPFRPT